MYGPNKLIWTINMEGSAFLPIGQAIVYEGNPEVKSFMSSKVIPEINRNIGKIWLKDQ
jgi:hypothetical protein